MPFEYKVLGYSPLPKSASKEEQKEHFQKWLDILGDRNWQIVSFLPGYTRFICMREKEINPKLREIQTKEDENNGSKSGETPEEIPG